ncbi:hypothetical protein ACVURJ_24160, partial [Escherichia coli]
MGKGSSKGHTPREAKDNLKSTQLLSVIDAISEGPVEGPVDGLKSVLLNSTPVLDSEGNTNISGVTVVFRAGEQEQTPPEGFESSGSETVLGTEVKYDTPITKTTSSFDYGTKSTNNTGAHTHSLSGSTNAAGNHSHRDGRRFNPSVFKDTYQHGYTSSGQNTWGVQGSVGMSTGWLANTSTDGNH